MPALRDTFGLGHRNECVPLQSRNPHLRTSGTRWLAAFFPDFSCLRWLIAGFGLKVGSAERQVDSEQGSDARVTDRNVTPR